MTNRRAFTVALERRHLKALSGKESNKIRPKLIASEVICLLAEF